MADLVIETREGFGLAAIMASRGIGAERIGTALGCMAPTGPRRTGDATLSLIGTGPGTWLAHTDTASPFWADELRDRLTGLASVSDQSSAYVVLRLSGPGARIVLQRGMPIDLHPDAFGPGSVASSVISHVGVIVWQLDDAPTYEVATFRSVSGSFRHWLDITAAAL